MITHPEKVLFPDDGITKGELAEYYEAVGAVMLPHLRNRPITMERFPAGIGKKGFWQKSVEKGFPEWLERVEVGKKGGVVHHPIVTDQRGLMWLTNQNTITHHVWTSRVPDLDHPDLCVFDLDPSKDDAAAVRTAAIELRDLLEELVAALVDQDLRLQGLSHRRSARRQDGDRRCRAFRRRGGRAVRQPRARSADAGIQQGRS